MPEIEYIGPLDKKEDVGGIEYIGPLDEGIQQPDIGNGPILDDLYIPPGIDRQQVKEAEIDAKTINELFDISLTPSAAHKLRPHIDQHIEDSWGQIFIKSAKSVYPAFMTGAGGLIRAFEEVSRIPGEKPVFEPGTIVPTGKEIADYWGGILREQDINAADSKLKRYAGMIIQNVAQNAPMLVVGAATGGAALPLTVFGLQSGGQKFQQMREEGQGTGASLVGGSIVGLSEAMTELLPFEALIKPGISFAKRLVLSASLDVPGELVNTAVEASVDKVTITPDMTMEDFGKALAETAIVSLGSAGLLTTMAHPIVWAREEQAKKDKLIEAAKEEENKSMIAEQEAITTEAVQEIQDKIEEVEAAPAEEVVPEISEQDFDKAFDSMVMSEQKVEESTLDTMMQEEPVVSPTVQEIEPEIDKALKGESILNESGAIDIAKFVELGKTIWDEGHITYQAFKTRVQEIVGEMWDKVRTEVLKVWEMVKEFNEKLGEEGSVGKPDKAAKKRIREITGQVKADEPTVTEPTALKASMKKAEQASKAGFKEGVKVGIEKALTPKQETIKQRIRRVTGQTTSKGEISEPEALRAAMVKAVQAGKAAYRAGKSEELAKAKERFKKIGMRRQKVKAILDALAMPDETIKQITRKNFLLMTDFEFKNFMDDLKEKSLELEEKAIAKATLEEVIIRKRLRKYDNYRRVLELPPIHKMTTEQLFEFADILDQFQEDDVFLTERELETVDKTDLKGIRTWREARERLAKEANVSIEELSQVKVTWWDKFRWDTPLAETNPFYGLMVGETTKKLLQATERSYKVETEVKVLAKKANASRKQTITERLIPQDKQIMDYLESPDDMKAALANEMTGEQLELAQYMEKYFADALNHLIAIKTLDKGRENYYTHIRRSFLEVAKDDGLVAAFKELFQSYQEEQMVFNILDEDTGNILPLEKFFQFSLRRTGALTPTQNVLKAFMVYVKTFEKKVALDELIPKIDIYAQSLTPTRYTPRGLEIDRSLKKFVNKYINNKKGRHIDMGFVKQGDKVDLTIRALRTFTTLLDLGLNIPVGIASLVGEHAANFEMIGIKGLAIAKKRQYTAKGKAILAKYKNFTGRSVWEEFNAPGKEVTERLLEGMFGLFHQATVMANKDFLLASITEDEYNSGTISDERLATLRIEMGRFRVVPGTKSLVGSTSVGSAGMQYKTWAGAIARTVIKDIETLTTDIKNKPLGQALTTREAREIYRIIGMATTILLVFGIGDDKDKSTIGRLKYLVWRESLSVLQAISPDMWLSTPRIIGFISQLGKNLKSLIMLEEYKTKPGLKGVEGLKKQLTPAIVRPQKKKKEADR